MIRRAWQRLGRRGLFLLLVAAVQAAYGAGLLAAAGHPSRAVHWWPASLGQLGGIPLDAWGILWVTIGALCLAGAWTTADRYAYAAAELLSTGWAAFALQRWMTAREPGSWALAVIYGGIAAGILIVSGWPEPRKPPGPPP